MHSPPRLGATSQAGPQGLRQDAGAPRQLGGTFSVAGGTPATPVRYDGWLVDYLRFTDPGSHQQPEQDLRRRNVPPSSRLRERQHDRADTFGMIHPPVTPPAMPDVSVVPGLGCAISHRRRVGHACPRHHGCRADPELGLGATCTFARPRTPPGSADCDGLFQAGALSFHTYGISSAFWARHSRRRDGWEHRQPGRYSLTDRNLARTDSGWTWAIQGLHS